MGVDATVALSQGDIMRRLRDLEKLVERLAADRSLEAASVGRGGLRIHSGGSLLMDDGGDIRVAGGRVVVEGESGVETIEDASVVSLAEDGSAARLEDGRIRLLSGFAGEINGQVFAGVTDPDDRLSVQAIPPRTIGDTGDNRLTVEGGSSAIFPGGIFGVTKGPVRFDAETGFAFASVDGRVFLDPLGSTSDAANVNIGVSGLLARVTSTARDKQDIEDLYIDPSAVLSLQPRTWRDRADVARDPDSQRWHVGLVAEDVDSAGLHEFVDYDADGQPQSVAYDRLCVALLAVLQGHERRLAELGSAPTEHVPQPRKPKRLANQEVEVPVPSSPSIPSRM